VSSIHAIFRDGATDALINRLEKPGMDRLTWVETDAESEFFSYRGATRARVDAAMINKEWNEVAPWPLEINAHHPVDNDDVHANFAANLSIYDDIAGEAWHMAQRQIVDHSFDETDGTYGEVLQRRTPAETRDVVENPTEWIRLPFMNEINGLGSPTVFSWHGLADNSYRLSVPDNLYYTPFDLTDDSKYACYEEDGTTRIPNYWMNLWPDDNYIITLRPREWYTTARTMAWYFRVTPWFIQIFNVTFVASFHNRPPVWPYRHDVYHSSQSTEGSDYWGTPVSYDYGVYYQFATSRSAQLLRRQISLVQSYDMCMVYVLYYVEPATLFMQTEEPLNGAVVCTITKKDQHGDPGPPVVVRQIQKTSYGRTSIGTFSSDFYYFGGGGWGN